jgi:hypothetical protein
MLHAKIVDTFEFPVAPTKILVSPVSVRRKSLANPLADLLRNDQRGVKDGNTPTRTQRYSWALRMAYGARFATDASAGQ